MLRKISFALLIGGLLATLPQAASAGGHADRIKRAYSSAREKITYRPNHRTSIRPNTSGVEIEHRSRKATTHVHIGKVRRHGMQSKRSTGYGIAIGVEF